MRRLPVYDEIAAQIWAAVDRWNGLGERESEVTKKGKCPQCRFWRGTNHSPVTRPGQLWGRCDIMRVSDNMVIYDPAGANLETTATFGCIRFEPGPFYAQQSGTPPLDWGVMHQSGVGIQWGFECEDAAQWLADKLNKLWEERE